MLYRTALYVPADHDSAMAKSGALEVDMLIFDLEDGVAPERKAYGRKQMSTWLSHHSRLGRNDILRLVRINHCTTTYYADDIAALRCCPIDGVMLSKVSCKAEIDDAIHQFCMANRADIAIWCNVETPLGVANAFEIAAHQSVVGLVAGTNDLANDLRIQRTPDRSGLMHSLQRILLAARAYGKVALDGTFIDFDDEAGLKAEAEQGRMLGFDGKTLVHPKQISIAKKAFSPSEAELFEARAIIERYEKALQEHKAVILMENGRMLERLHYDRAREVLGLL